MQLVLSNNRIIAHGENFLAMGGVVINTETGAKYENATVAECEGCPSDIDSVGYEYHAGVFVPCAPFGKGNNNGYFMEVCKDCATPRSSGIPIKGGIKLVNLAADVTANNLGGMAATLLWENALPTSGFEGQTLNLSSAADCDLLMITSQNGTSCIMPQGTATIHSFSDIVGSSALEFVREIVWQGGAPINFSSLYYRTIASANAYAVSISNPFCTPYQIYGVKL